MVSNRIAYLTFVPLNTENTSTSMNGLPGQNAIFNNMQLQLQGY